MAHTKPPNVSLAHKRGVGTHLLLPQIFHEINTDFNFLFRFQILFSALQAA